MTETSEWIEHDGGSCPVAETATVEVEHPVGLMTVSAGLLKWPNGKRPAYPSELFEVAA